MNLNIDLSNLNINEEKGVTETDGHDLIGLYIKIIKWFMQYDKEEFSEKLLEYGFSNNFLDKFPLKYENKLQFKVKTNYSNNIHSLKWRIDISLSNKYVKLDLKHFLIAMLMLYSFFLAY